jgi:SAM-dependent methyltransferase
MQPLPIALPNTGERCVPDSMAPDDRVLLEHVARYAWAVRLLGPAPRRVLDAPCGAGYGTQLLAQAGHHVVGLDVDPNAVAYARTRYAHERARFRVADLAGPGLGGPFAAVVCFEGIEHVRDQATAAANLCQALAPGGVLLVSAPIAGSPGAGSPFHVAEPELGAFVELFAPRLRTLRLAGQVRRPGDADLGDAWYVLLVGQTAGPPGPAPAPGGAGPEPPVSAG